jgi:hypothetical protein
MIQPSKNRFDDDPDDLGLELPPFGEGRGDDEAWQPDDDSDLGLDSGDVAVGLDADLGLDDDAELDADDEDRLEESWLESGELGTELGGDDDFTNDDGEEGGLGEGSEPGPSTVEDFTDDDGWLEEREEADEDSGQEGFGDDAALPDLDLDRLPPLDDGLATEAEDHDLDALTAELLGDLSEPADAGDPPSSAEPLANPQPRLEQSPADVRIESLLSGGPPLSHLVASGGIGVGWNGTLLVAERSATRPEPRFSGADSVRSLAALDTGAGLYVALATQTGLLGSRDGGRTFAPLAGLPDGRGHGASIDRVALTAREQGPLLWAAVTAAGVWVSDDFGATFRKAQAASAASSLAVDAERGLVLLRGDSGPAGRRGTEDRCQLWTHRDLIVAARSKPVPQLVFRRCDLAESDWRVLPHAAPPATLVVEGAFASVYFVSPGAAGRRVVRRQLLPQDSGDQILGELPETTGAPLLLAGSHANGFTTLLLSAERSLYRLVFRVGGARHAP